MKKVFIHFLVCKGLTIDDVGVSRDTVPQEIGPGAGFETGDFVKEKLGEGLPQNDSGGSGGYQSNLRHSTQAVSSLLTLLYSSYTMRSNKLQGILTDHGDRCEHVCTDRFYSLKEMCDLLLLL